METVFSVLVGLGLAAACGFRVFVPLLVASVAMQAGYLTPTPEFAWLGSPVATGAFALATALEIGAYYIPWLDHALDTIATPSAMVAGTLVAGSIASDLDPFARWTMAAIAGGGLAGAVQSASVVLRGMSFTVSGGLANPVVATAELAGAVATSALAVIAPGFAILGLLAVALFLLIVWRRRRAATTTQAT
jgi:hypothetical protein